MKKIVLAVLALALLAGCGGGGGGEKVPTPVPNPQVRLMCSINGDIVFDIMVDKVLYQADGIWIVRNDNLAKLDSGAATCVEAR